MMIGVTSSQDAYAVADCDGPDSVVLEAGALYIGTQNSILAKVDTIPVIPEACEIGVIREDPGDEFSNVVCEDIAIDHSDEISPGVGQLYCIGFGNSLYTIDRTADFELDGTPTAMAGDGEVINADRVGGATNFINIGGVTQTFIDAFEIDLYGKAYIAADGLNAGKFYNLDLTTAVATLRTDFNTLPGVPAGTFASSGDLARDESMAFDMYWTVECDGLSGTLTGMAVAPNFGVDAVCDDADNDVLMRINLGQGPGGAGLQDSITRIDELPEGDVFAIEIIQPSFDLCFLTTLPAPGTGGVLFETDRTGTVTRTSVTITPDLQSFGATGNAVGGMLIMINTMSLAVAAAQTNPAWLLLFAISGAAVVAYQFKGKTKTRKKTNT